MADQIVITEKTSQAKDVRAAVGSRYGDILPAEGHLFDAISDGLRDSIDQAGDAAVSVQRGVRKIGNISVSISVDMSAKKLPAVTQDRIFGKSRPGSLT